MATVQRNIQVPRNPSESPYNEPKIHLVYPIFNYSQLNPEASILRETISKDTAVITQAEQKQMQQDIITLNALNLNAKDSFDHLSESTFNIKDHQLFYKLSNVLTTHFTNLSGIFTFNAFVK